MPIELPTARVRAPELSGAEGWLNTERPLTLAALRGRVVLLHFWTYCCIPCLHVLTELKQLEDEHRDTLVVVGVHSAKFANEGEAASLREAVARYEVAHPVANDRHLAIWRAYGVRDRPTVVAIDAAGDVVGQVSGEGHGPLLHEIVGALVEEARRRGTLAPVAAPAAAAPPRVGLLRYPGKIAVDELSGRVVIADTNHHRLVIAAVDGQMTRVVGRGEPGADDGALVEATFRSPQGVAFADEVLYVADTGNHLVRAVDLDAGTVRTLAGTGEQARAPRAGAARGRDTALNSPWDLALVDGVLFVAMAGPHQIWTVDADRGTTAPYAGTGREGRQDGPRQEAVFAQPSGITADDRYLYVADSETSSIRAIDRYTERVETVVGLDLLQFGDRDGVGTEARLQHPLGVTAWKGLVYVADTYNHKVKILDPVTRRITTLAGTGRPDVLFEPGGLAVGLGWLWVADTNHHAVQVVDLTTGAAHILPLAPL